MKGSKKLAEFQNTRERLSKIAAECHGDLNAFAKTVGIAPWNAWEQVKKYRLQAEFWGQRMDVNRDQYEKDFEDGVPKTKLNWDQIE
jgi:hypothetical protein